MRDGAKEGASLHFVSKVGLGGFDGLGVTSLFSEMVKDIRYLVEPNHLYHVLRSGRLSECKKEDCLEPQTLIFDLATVDLCITTTLAFHMA